MVTKGSLRKPDYEPEDKAKERCRNNKMDHRVIVNLKYQCGGVSMGSEVLIRGDYQFLEHAGCSLEMRGRPSASDSFSFLSSFYT